MGGLRTENYFKSDQSRFERQDEGAYKKTSAEDRETFKEALEGRSFLEVKNHTSLKSSSDIESLKQFLADDIETLESFLLTKNNIRYKSSTDIEGMKQSFQSDFTQLAKNKEGFYKVLEQAFGTNYDRDAAESIRIAAVNGDFSWLPDVTVLDNDEFSAASLNGGKTEGGVFLGAFDKSNNSILINSSVLSNDGLANNVYSEEAGHALDNILNRVADAKGDEGAIFSKLLGGETLTTAQLETLRSENDHGVVAGKEVEFYTSVGMLVATRDHIFAVAYHDVVTGKDDIGSKDPLLNNAKYREDLLIEKAKAYANDPTNENKEEFNRIRDLIFAPHSGGDGYEYDHKYVIEHDGSELKPLIRDYNKHVSEEAKKGNFLLASNGFTFFLETSNYDGDAGHWLDVNFDSFKNNSCFCT
jgi:hypothetical protein